MQNILGKYEAQIYALVRIIVGFLFACHGAQKLFGLFGGLPPDVPAFVRYGVGIYEFAGGLMIMVGFKGSLAAFLCSGLMAGAYFLVHQKNGVLPIMNHGEPAAVYSWIFLLIAAKGSGIWSVDGNGKAIEAAH